MFDLVFFKLKTFHDKLSNKYAYLISKHWFLFLVGYVSINIVLLTLLFVLKFNFILDTQSLLFTRNSQYDSDCNIMKKFFEQDQNKRHYLHQLLDTGYYVDIIIESKEKPKDNLINETYLNDYNRLFDDIVNLSIAYDNKIYKYNSDLCAKRLDKCSIEGGLMRDLQFQSNLLKKEINYNIDDPRSVYMDQGAKDGASMEFLFGKRSERNERIDNKTKHELYGYSAYIEGAKYVRTRFDLKYNTNQSKILSKLWINRFVKYMKANSSEFYPSIKVYYTTSTTIEEEIAYYSQFDVNYVLVTLIVLILFYIIYMWIDVRTNLMRLYNRLISLTGTHKTSIKVQQTVKNGTSTVLNSPNTTITSVNSDNNVIIDDLLNQTDGSTNNDSKISNKTTTKKCKKQTNTIKFDFYLPILCLIQLFLTLTSTLCIINLLSLKITPLLATNALILIIISFNQTLNLYKSLNLMINTINNSKINIQKQLTNLFQILLVPQMYSCLMTTVVYLLISWVTLFDAVRIYCIFTGKFIFFIMLLLN